MSNRTSDEILASLKETRDKQDRAPRGPLSLRSISLEKVNRQLLNVLQRDVENLLRSSFEGKLTANDSNALTNYLKLLKDLKKQEESDADNLSDEQLEKIASN